MCDTSSGICMAAKSAQSQLRRSLDWMLCENCESMCLAEFVPVGVLFIQASSSPPGLSIATGFLRSETTHLCSHLCWNGCKKTNIYISNFCGNNFFLQRNGKACHMKFLNSIKVYSNGMTYRLFNITLPNGWNHTHLNWHVMLWISLKFEIYSHILHTYFCVPDDLL